uniref:Rho GTPase-activating protein 1 n=1 Tax=Sphaerodactylus townsendi TaxID=933632 RepID=A0ACB8G3M2_9SAUR
MDQFPDLQEDPSLEDTNESLNQLKLASLDDKNWPADETPIFPKDDSKSSPDSATHLRWDDPYYDIARHQIVEVAGKGFFSSSSAFH